MSQSSMVAENDSPLVSRHKQPAEQGGSRAIVGGWKAIAAASGVVLLGTLLTVVPLLIRMKHDRALLARMSGDLAADFVDGERTLGLGWGVIGSILTLTGAVVVWRYLLARERESSSSDKYLTAMELLHRTIMRVSSHMGQGRQILTEMAEAARRLLGMDSSGVFLLDMERRIFRVHAVTGRFPLDAPSSFTVEQTPACFSAAQSGEIIFLGDADAAPPGINVELVKRLGARSVAVIPLRLDGKPVGVMVLADTNARRFTDVDRRLVELLGAQTETILANSRLYEKARSAVSVYQDLLRQQEMLYEVSAAIYRAPSFEESARAITARAPAVLHVDACSVQVCEDGGRTQCVLAASGDGGGEIVGLKSPIAGSYLESVLKSGKMLVIEDAQRADGLSKDLVRIRRVGSIVFLPLKQTDGRPLGGLVLIRHHSGSFPDEQLRLFKVFADRAEAALENALLQEQSRRDARAKTILLRELHHRVNNNLAGIVALLSMNQPAMSDDAHRWLRRSIERIEAMARAHDLFSHGDDRVRLGNLVSRVPESIAVFQTAQTRIRTEIECEDLTLATPRAVSLAMVLHELCSNALLHGVKSGGEVTIRGVCMDSRIAVQVCDDGVGFDPGEDASGCSVSRRGGFGLQLVRELVSRELRGTLHIESAPGRGTTVSIAFPLDRDEEYHL